MSDPLDSTARPIDVAVIGGGPAGLAAATVLKARGIARVVVIERESEAGGIPRHCGHFPFGMREFRRILRGPDYAARLVARARAAGVEILTRTSVTGIATGGRLSLARDSGLAEIAPRRVILATGVRETPRSARLISGDRVQGVMNTGALQSLVYLKNMRPFRAPVIVGSELVAFSAITTCRHGAIAPRAMIEAQNRPTARWPSGLYPRLAGVPLLTGTELVAIHGDTTVTGVTVRGPDGARRQIGCDGVILTGMFTPESTLAHCAPLAVDPHTGGPVVDQWGRCSDPAFFATGNLLRPVETAGWSWREGCRTGAWVADDLDGALPAPDGAARIELHDARLRYAMPQTLVRADGGMAHIQLRVGVPVRGTLVARVAGQVLVRRRIDTRPERRILLPLHDIAAGAGAGPVEIAIE